MSKHRILLQAGHLAPRETGFEGGTGGRHEQEYVTRMRDLLERRFRADGRFDVTPTPGNLPEGWTGSVALYLHLDGSVNPASSGMSFGYQTPQGARLAQRIRHEFALAGHPGASRRDNYTRDLAGYYGFNHVNATHEVLIEHGFGSNPGEYSWLLANADKLANGTYHAVLEHLGLKLGQVRGWKVGQVLTLEQSKFRNNLTVRVEDPAGVRRQAHPIVVDFHMARNTYYRHRARLYPCHPY